MRKLVVITLLAVLALMGTSILSAGVSPDSRDYDAWKQQQVYTPEVAVQPNQPSQPFSIVKNDAKDVCDLLVPWDSTFTLAMAPNDDGSTGQITLPFTFTLYGTPYNYCWVNNNGNVTFDYGLSSYTPWGFPSGDNPMLAPFFADVDTRGTGSVWYKIEANRMIVIWDHVGYFSYGVDKLNTFELIFSDGTDPLIGLGNNVAFSYADMAWTTGSASGGVDGFGGSPATVGINKGDNIEYAQIGRFDHAGIDYDGPYNNNDGVDWLDCQLFLFNTGGEAANVAPVFVTTPPSPVELTVGDVWSFDVTVIAPETAQLTNATISHDFPMSYTITPANTLTFTLGCTATAADIGVHLVTIIATDDGTPPLSSSYEFEIIISEDGYTPVELSGFTATLSATNDVQISWTSQSETNLMGYRVYRNESADQTGSLLITPVLIPATNTSEQHSYSVSDPEVEIGHSYYYWLESVDSFTSQFFGPVSITVQGDVPPVNPETSALKNAYPNPFKASGSTSIGLDVKAGETGTLTILNLAGQVVRSYSVGEGSHTINWNGTDANGKACSSGVYFYKLSTPSLNQTRKMVILK
ncbi:MAG: T9SS type A sorting domain-containing protein [Candidatus Cloacimonetes bacterium]|jgi:hypothetical protein|nr:T9SS type A sorting domain-containing protein [Candidatus Cloacimonadota bacterium]MDY0367966.1 T9SS type A sorting domain-containing protein [Candidatus Syntrophosphaera sp.]